MASDCDCGVLIQSQMESLADIAVEWCKQRGMEATPLNIVRACSELGTVSRSSAKSLIEHNWKS